MARTRKYRPLRMSLAVFDRKRRTIRVPSATRLAMIPSASEGRRRRRPLGIYYYHRTCRSITRYIYRQEVSLDNVDLLR